MALRGMKAALGRWFRPGGRASHQEVASRLKEGNARIASLVKDVQSMSEREVMACGGVLAEIVEKVRYLTGESERAAASSIERSRETAARFVEGMREDIAAQETSLKHLLSLAQGIEKAIEEIDGLTRFAGMLAINAKIEAVRLGEQGSSFEVIADNLRGFSGTVKNACERVNSSILGVRNGVPPVSARAASMQERTRQFISEVAEQVKAVSLETETNAADGGGLASVIELSNRALSHLQFEDPMSQTLSSINVGLEAMRKRVAQLLDGEGGPEASIEVPFIEVPALASPLKDADELEHGGKPASGEMVLF